jgi:hypothetical protein
MQLIKSSPCVQRLSREEFCKPVSTSQLVFSLNCSQQLFDPQKDPLISWNVNGKQASGGDGVETKKQKKTRKSISQSMR